MIYLDYAASTPMSDAAIQTYTDTAKKFFANSKGLHDAGCEASSLLEHCRGLMANFLGGQIDGITFTGSGSEANVIPIYGLAQAHKDKGSTILTTGLNHPSSNQVLEKLQGEGFVIKEVPVNKDGELTWNELKAAIDEDTILVVLTHVNSETGIMQNLKRLCNKLSSYGLLTHVDLVQSFGKMKNIRVDEFGISSCAISGHKIYGPKGVGACYINPSLRCEPRFPGMTHEHGLTHGTTNLPAIAAITEAASQLINEQADFILHLNELKQYMVEELNKNYLPFDVVGDPRRTFPGILGLVTKQWEGQYILLHSNRNGIAISAGTACQASIPAAPKSLHAIGLSTEEANRFIRISFGKATTKEHIDKCINVLEKLGNKIII